jgi:class 3 adenylate cyclase/tetratricopeptide (TPR) repeat protein
MARNQEVLHSFVPVQLVEWLTAREQGAEDPPSDQVELVTWFADLSNFSHTTDEITKRDRTGPEMVGDLLNRTFGAIIDTIASHGGKVYDFAGDSVLATWDVGADGDRATALALAAHCGLEVLMLELPKLRDELPDLNLRIGIGVGKAVYVEIGGVDDEWLFVTGGKPFNQIGLASAVARPGEVVLSPEAARAIDDRVRGYVDENGFLRLADVAPLQLEQLKAAGLTPALESEVRRFVAPAVLRRIDAGQSEWLAEFRQITSVFINLPGMELASVSSRDALQDVVKEAQNVLRMFEGSLRQVIDDDKGVTLVASFGIPPFAHEEDPYLAVQAAEAVQDKLQEMKLEYGIGVATGRAFCGAIGSALRRNYTTIGSDVNLAARLMKAAKFEILCDETTARAARRVEFHDLGERGIKGWDQPIRVFKPLWEKRVAAGEVDIPESLVGRESELNQLNSWLGALARARSSSVVVIEGDAGIGKSALAGKLIETAHELDVRVLFGEALPVAQAPYQAWREVISDVLDISEIRSLERRQEAVRERLRKWPEFLEWEALLNSVLDLDFPENATTRGMSGDNRRESTVELLVALLSDAAESRPLMIVLDDLHWFDSASWAVALGAARKVSPLLLVLLTRPNPEHGELLDDLTSAGTSAHFVLAPLGRDHALELARRALKVDQLAPEVADLIEKTSEGVPFFVEELALSLRDSDLLRVEGGIARLARPADELAVPQSLSSVVLNRIDRLAPDLQLTLKVASVIGRSFDTGALAAAHPSHPEAAGLESQLETLGQLELITESELGSYDFRHALTRDTAYQLLPFDMRRRIHSSVATFLESRGEQERERSYALLAYHWDHAEDHRKALTYYEKTGASALRKGANREAIEAHSRSLDLVAHHRDEFSDIEVLRQSQWHVEIAQAYEALSNFGEAERSLYRALDLLRVKVGSGTLGRLAGLAWEAAKQLVHIMFPQLVRPPHSEERARLAQASRVTALIGEVYYFQGDLTGFLLLNLMAINLGEKSGEPLVAGLAYSNLGYLVGTLRLRRLARRYFDRARAAEDLETHPQLVAMPYVLELQEMGPGHLIAVALSESVLALTFGHWAEALEIVTDGLARCVKLGDKYSAGIALAVRGFVHYSSGRLEDARIDYDQLLASARQRANREHEGWATAFSIPVLMALDRVEEAKGMTAAAVAILDDVDSITVPVIHGTRSQVLLDTGQLREAQASAELAARSFDSSPFFTYLVGFAGMLDTMLRLIEANTETPSKERAALVTEVRGGLKKLRRFARLLPFARPKYLLFKGRLESLEGHRSRALRSFRKGVALAESSGFTWDEGLLRLELARVLEPGSPQRGDELDRARRLFEVVGSTRDLQRVGSFES